MERWREGGWVERGRNSPITLRYRVFSSPVITMQTNSVKGPPATFTWPLLPVSNHLDPFRMKVKLDANVR